VVTSSANPSVFGQSVTFTATVAAVAPGAGTPSGTVTFTIDGTPQTPVALSSGTATLSTSSLSVGTHTVTAAYNGDSNFNTSNSTASPLTQTVNKANSTSGVSSSVNPSVFGQAVTFTATVTATAPGTGTPTGTVTFKDGATPIGTNTLSSGQATFTTSSLSVAGHTISVVYNGDGSFNTSTSPNLTQTVNNANTTTAVTSSANPSCFGQAITFTATVSAVAPGSGTPTGTVQFRIDGNNFGTVTLSGGSATSAATATLSAGNHIITAIYTPGSSFNTSTSPNFTQTVNALPTCSITGPSSVCANVNGNIYTAPAGMTAYIWAITGNGAINGATNAQSVIVNPAGGGSFTLTLTITGTNGCSSTCNTTVTVNTPPAITA